MEGKPDRRFKEVCPSPPLPLSFPLPHILEIDAFLPQPQECSTNKQHGGGQHGNQGGRETGFEEIGDGTSSLVTEGTGEDTGTYK